MNMSKWQSELDFISRTRKVIMGEVTKEEYDVTIFLNCCNGLLIAPQQSYEEKLPKGTLGLVVDYENWGINKEENIEIKSENGDEWLVENIAKHFRNSLAHSRFDVLKCNRDGEIQRILIKDIDPWSKETTFEQEFSFEDFKKFILKYSEMVYNELSKL